MLLELKIKLKFREYFHADQDSMKSTGSYQLYLIRSG